ncbi:hypothetical protein MKS88_002508 [Plasmodium brasilianum]|uniref:Uncharacterized protein n=2 Tax=Plasmodium (Plasmodium) TaxID=418103 RepID=A0A1A8VYY1_PLAMA|nr:conserved protein, unknown function [Plasmodium malariae]KAI4838996.1 hypothetical protein MKS88_002508 [Plasmodium brasilianum]SBS84909.1 conserved protein, unknown function [Plasmodium malariae]SBT79384.1 conserved protein, unknown function [Plasmodium malariae]SCN12346.1 conserved protein, unknown function [Plasmodium malariae]
MIKINLYNIYGATNYCSNFLSLKRFKSHLNSVSILQQFYNRLPIRKKYIKAIKKGTLIWDKGQVKIPPLKIEGYDPPKKCLSPLVKNRNNQYRGKFQNLKSHRVEFQD